MSYYLGIDGGGTKTEAVLCDQDGHILMRKLVGPSNPNDIGIEKSVSQLRALVETAHRRVVSLIGNDVALFIFCGISGALNHRMSLTEHLCNLFPQDHFTVHSDAINLLSSELYLGDGCCLICGTGSVCFVRRGEDIERIGGWGYLLDNSGSGFAMGREALEASLRAHDGRGDATLLTGALSKKLGGLPWEKLTEIYEGGKAYIASLAPCVLACVEEGDRIAFEILFRQALYLSECLEAAYHSIGRIDVPMETVLGGGLFGASAELHDLIKQTITVPIKLTVAAAPQVFGAVWEAVKMQSGTVTELQYVQFRNVFMQDYSA